MDIDDQSAAEARHVPPSYPFSAVVGHDDFKLALLANAVDPRIGGVLAAGDRGSAKSTLARSFAAMVDEAPFVDLPLGATIDRLTGGIDTERLLAGEGAVLSEGLLARADGGVLYVDEVNLLGDHLVDVVLDAAAFGHVSVERDGLSASSPTRFVLVGTMNPEEGELRPQLLDRFGLAVRVSAPQSNTDRRRVVERRLAFELDPVAFRDRFSATERALAEIVLSARASLADVVLSERQISRITALCASLGVEGVRADLSTARTARALAALDKRAEVIERDIETAARLAIPHRAATAAAAGWISQEQIDAALRADSESGSARGRATGVAQPAKSSPLASAPRTSAGSSRSDSESTLSDDVRAKAPNRPDLTSMLPKGRGPVGRSSAADDGERPSVDSRPATDAEDIDPIATARAAVTRRLLGGADVPDATRSTVPPAFEGPIEAGDLRQRVRSGRESNLVLCVVDASSSVLEHGRAGELRSLLAGLVSDSRRKRDRVGLIVFRGRDARLVAPPSRNHAAVLAGLDTIEPGGTTPLAEGIRVAHETALRERRRNPDLRPVVALVTDGYANIARSGDALSEARLAAQELIKDGVTLVVIGESTSGAPQFARLTKAEFYAFDARDAA